MHDEFAAQTLAKLSASSIVVVNTDVCTSIPDPSRTTTVGVAANELADAVGSRLTASMVLVGAYAAATGLVALPRLEAAIADALPSYRRKTVDVNVAAVRAGYEHVPRCLVPAWEGVPA
jgi:Pyruvate/2-oxoacid:ferredoxin oxidoreductase gamma subunit